MIDSMKTTIRTASLGLIAAGPLLSGGAPADAADPQAWIDEQVGGNETLSISAARVSTGDAAYFGAGPADADAQTPADVATRYQIGSLTKAFTHLLLAEMAAVGAVGYDTTVADLRARAKITSHFRIPLARRLRPLLGREILNVSPATLAVSLGRRNHIRRTTGRANREVIFARALIGERVEFANPDVGRITLLELATHTSGLPRLPANLAFDEPADPYAGYGEGDLLAAIASARHKQPLGDYYAYSNFGAGLLGYLLGRVDGGGYPRALTERVLGPLGLAAAGFDPADRRAAGFSGGEVVPDWTFDAMAGAGALWSSAEDLVRLARIMLGLSEHRLEHALDADREVIEPAANGYAVTRVWHVAESPDGAVYWHNGGTSGPST